jgi:RHS repeat-associated protein
MNLRAIRLVLLAVPALLTAQTAVTLTPTPSPTSGQPGITTITLTGSGFPSGTIANTGVTVSLKPAAGGAAVTTPSLTVTTVVLTTRRVTFTIPASVSVTTPTAYNVSISGATTATPPVAFASSNTASLTVNPVAQILTVTPNTGAPGQSLPVNILAANTNFVQGSTMANFGAGISVGGAAQAALGPAMIFAPTSTGVQLVIAPNAIPGPRSVTVTTGTQTATLANGFTVATIPPTVTSFSPASGATGTIVTITGTNFLATTNGGTQVTMPALNGGTIAVPLQSVSPTSMTVVIPSGAATGPLTVTNFTVSANTATNFTVNPSSTFTLTAAPSSANLIMGQSVSYAVSLSSSNGFNQLAPLSVTGLPAGVTAAFKPSSITAGQTSILTLTAPANQPVSTANLSIGATANVAGIPFAQSAAATLTIQGISTTFMGRAVAADSLETPLAGVTVTMLGLDGAGNQTGCAGNTVSDAAGNFTLSNLPTNCIGPQLVGFGGNNVTSPPGKYAGVNLVYTLVPNQVVVSPVLVHLPIINNAETFQVQQNYASDQTYTFTTIPGLKVTVYAGTTFTMADGTQPNPFPLAAIQVPVDRLPDVMPVTNAGVVPFIVAFQPANTTASQEVAVYYPNTLNNPPGTNMPLMTLNPTLGRMVPYGTGTVSADGTQIIPDIDPSTGALQHRFGIVHFDWHGWLAKLINALSVAGVWACSCGAFGGIPAALACGLVGFAAGAWVAAGEPIDVSSGLHVMRATDMVIRGTRGTIGVQRVYRSATANDGSFGIGAELQYVWQLDTANPATIVAGVNLKSTVVNLISPDGNRFPFTLQSNGTFLTTSVPALLGAVLKPNGGGETDMRFKDGTVWKFQARGTLSVLTAIVDRNGNTTSLTLIPVSAQRLGVSNIIDAVGRSISLVYDSNGHVVSATDPMGRSVTYTYTSAGYLATVTDPAGGVTKFQYNSSNQLTTMTDARGVTTFQDTFDANGRVTKQVLSDGGVFQFSYTLTNALVPTSPVLATTVTDPNGNQTIYRFNPQGFLTDVTDALGQTKSFMLAAGTNEVIAVNGPAQCDACGQPGQGPQNYAYDGIGNLLTATDALGNSVAISYDPTFNQITSVTNQLGAKSLFSYDTFGNLTSSTDPNGNTTRYSYGPSGLLAKVTDPLGNVTTLSYDNFSNPVALTDPLGNTAATAFDLASRPISTVDPLGKTTTISYDALDRIVSARDGRLAATLFAYDAVGNILSITDARGGATTFTYDTRSRIRTRTSPLGKSDSMQYDLDGNLIQYTDRRGQTSSNQYDQLNRLVKETYQDGAIVARSYDPYSRLLTVNDSVGGVFGFGYDANGSLISQVEPTGSIAYTRDQLHRVSTRQVMGQAAVSYSYDAVGNLLGAYMPTAGVTYSYDARNLPKTLSRTNGVVSTYTFDPLGRVLSLIHSNGATALNTQTYAYDASGNRNSSTNDIAQPLITQAAAAAVDVANELLTNGPTTYTSDANGNRLTETNASGTIKYQWDGRNRLASITDSSGDVTSFRYDFGRNLIEVDKTAAGAPPAQRFVVDSLTNVASLTDSFGLPASVLTGRSVDSHYGSVDSAGNVIFGLGDALGSIVAVTNASGARSATGYYEPYGQTTGQALVSYPFEFAGRIPVSANLYYLRNRFYDPNSGKLLSEDPSGFVAGDGNLYRYVMANPGNGTDPTGLDTSPLLIAAPVAAAVAFYGTAALGLAAAETPVEAALGALGKSSARSALMSSLQSEYAAAVSSETAASLEGASARAAANVAALKAAVDAAKTAAARWVLAWVTAAAPFAVVNWWVNGPGKN